MEEGVRREHDHDDDHEPMEEDMDEDMGEDQDQDAGQDADNHGEADERDDEDDVRTQVPSPVGPKRHATKGKGKEVSQGTRGARMSRRQPLSKARQGTSNMKKAAERRPEASGSASRQGHGSRRTKKAKDNAGVRMPEDTGLPVISRSGRSCVVRERNNGDGQVNSSSCKASLTRIGRTIPLSERPGFNLRRPMTYREEDV